MAILNAALLALGAVVAFGALVTRAVRTPQHRLVQTKLDVGV